MEFKKKFKKIHTLKLYIKSVVFVFGEESINLIRFSNVRFSCEDEISHVIHGSDFIKVSTINPPNDLPMPTTNIYNFRTEFILRKGGGGEITGIPISVTAFMWGFVLSPGSDSRNSSWIQVGSLMRTIMLKLSECLLPPPQGHQRH